MDLASAALVEENLEVMADMVGDQVAAMVEDQAAAMVEAAEVAVDMEEVVEMFTLLF